MSAMATHIEPGLFFDQLPSAPMRLLLLDYDGTIAPFRCERDRAVPYPTVPELLDSIMSTCHTRVVLLSGRAVHEVAPLLGLNPHPEIWGTHGFERLTPSDEYECGSLDEGSADAFQEAARCLYDQGLEARRVELKPAAIAVHWRGSWGAELDEIRTKAYQALAPLACKANLLLNEFDGGLELRARGCTKDHAVRRILAEAEPGAAVAYLGDDVADEDAFRELNDRGLTVLVGERQRPSAARMWLKPPQGVIQFLCDWIRACRGDV